MTPEPRQRLFFALWPDDALREELHTAAIPVTRSCGGRAVPAADYHLTLAFLGSVPASRVPDVSAAARPLTLPGFSLTLDRFGWFQRPRVAWLGTEATPAALGRFVAALWATLGTVGLWGPGEAPGNFHPHVTLCRKALRRPEAAAPPRPVPWQPRDFVLVQSVTAREAARYSVLDRFGAP